MYMTETKSLLIQSVLEKIDSEGSGCNCKADKGYSLSEHINIVLLTIILTLVTTQRQSMRSD